jgi:ribosomal protein S18 acetylase RimI-like enzyme
MTYYKDIVNIWKKAGIEVGSSDTKEEIEKMMKKNPHLFLMGKKDEKVVAVVLGGYDGRRGYVHHLAVDPDFQNKGIGESLMNELTLRFKAMGVHKIHLFIEKYNMSVLKFYKKMGWQVRDDLIMMSYVPDEKLYKRKI